MTIEPTEIVRSAQVWVCDSCGNHAPKACGCNSTAHMEAMVAKREANRQAVRAHRQRKTQEKQRPRNDYTGTDGDSEETCWRRGLLYRADEALKGAAFEEWSRFKIDRQLVTMAQQAADAWNDLARYLGENYAD